MVKDHVRFRRGVVVNRLLQSMAMEPRWMPYRVNFYGPGLFLLHEADDFSATPEWWAHVCTTVKARRKTWPTTLDLCSACVFAWATSRPYVPDTAIVGSGKFEETDVFNRIQLQTANNCKGMAYFGWQAWRQAASKATSLPPELAPCLDYVPFFAYTIAQSAYSPGVQSYCGHAVCIVVRKDLARAWLDAEEPGITATLDGPLVRFGDSTVFEDGSIDASASAEDATLNAFARKVHAAKPVGPDEAVVHKMLMTRAHEVRGDFLTHVCVCSMVCDQGVFVFVRDGEAYAPSFTELGDFTLRLQNLDDQNDQDDELKKAHQTVKRFERPTPVLVPPNLDKQTAFVDEVRKILAEGEPVSGSATTINTYIRYAVLAETEAWIVAKDELDLEWAVPPSEKRVKALGTFLRDRVQTRIVGVYPDVGGFVRVECQALPFLARPLS